MHPTLIVVLGFAAGGYCFVAVMLPSPFDKFAWLAGLVGFAAPFLYIMRLGKKRMKAFEGQFPDSLRDKARQLKC